MNLEIRKANPETESEQLSAMQVAVLPDEKPFPKDIWMEEKIETWWVMMDGEKVGIVSIEMDSAPGSTYESDSEPSPGSIYLILIGLIPKWQGIGLGKVAMNWLKTKARTTYGCSRIVSNLRPSNTCSVDLHAGEGFRVIGYKPDYYPNPIEGSLVLELKL